MKKISFSAKKAGLTALCTLLGAILSSGGMLSFPSPLAAVLPAVLSKAYGVAAILGTVIGGTFTVSLRIIPTAAAGVAALISRTCIKGFGARRRCFATAAISAAVYLIFSSVLCTVFAEGAAGLLRSTVFAAILFAADAAFFEAATLFRSASRIPSELILTLCGMSVCALCPLGQTFLLPGAAVSAYFILFASLRFGTGAAACTAAVCAAGAAFSSPEVFAEFAVLEIPALLCSLSFFDGPYKASAAFTVISSVLSLINGSGADFILSCAVGAAVFAVTYKPALKFSADILSCGGSVPRSFRAEALRTASQDMSERVLGMRGGRPKPLSTVSDAVYSKVCMGCPNNSSCFETSDSLFGLDTLSQFGGEELSRTLPFCTKIPEIRKTSCETVKRREYLANIEKTRTNAVNTCAQMLSMLEYAVTDAESAVLKSVSADKRLSQRLSSMLKKEGVRFIRCSVYPSLDVEIAFSETARINDIKIAGLASKITGAEYSKPERCEIGCGSVLQFTPKCEYTFEAGGCQLPAEGDASGDVSLVFSLGQYSYAVLSDGMGIGRPARAVALMLINLLKEFLTAGFSIDTAIRAGSIVISSAAPDESFATLDLLRLNRNTGAAEVYKAGGCQSLLISDGSGSLLRAGGYPIGILDRCDVKIQRFFVKDSATLVMATDGAQELSPKLCIETLNRGEELSASELAARLLERASSQKNAPKDDVSVTVVRIKRRTA